MQQKRNKKSDFLLSKKHKRICKKCKKLFLGRIQHIYCDYCNEIIDKLCKCGCGKTFKVLRRKSNLRLFIHTHNNGLNCLGKVPWNKEKNKNNYKVYKKWSVSRKGKNNPFNKKRPEGFSNLTKEERIKKFATYGNLGIKCSNEKKEKIRLSNMETISRKLANGEINTGGWSRHGSFKFKHNGIQRYDSSYELKRMTDLDDQGYKFKKAHKIRIKYYSIGKKRYRYYIPDLLVFDKENNSRWLEEIKSSFTKKADPDFDAKIKAAKKWCKQQNIEFYLLDDDNYFKLRNAKLIEDEIVEISEVGEDEFFGVCVPKHKNYFCEDILNHNSGKDTVAAIAFAYVIHILLCCSDPQKFVGLEIPGEPIDFINVAINKEQAASVFFTKFQQRIKRWEWLKQKYPVRVSGRSLTGATTGKNKIDADNEVVITTTGILFPKMLRAFSGNSEEESQEGKNYLMFVMDEVGGYKTTKQHSPNKIFKVLQSSARTRFQSKWFGFILSYPRYKDDYIETMRKKAEKRLHWHSSKCTSWEVKPLRLFSGKWFEFDGMKIPLEFKEDFEDDPIDARTKHLCIPPDAVNPFIEDHEKIELVVKSKNKQMFEFYDYIKDGYVCKKVKLAPHVKNILATKYTLTIDLGVSQCGCAISLHHKEVDGNIDIIKQDMVTRWEPDPKKGLRVDFFNAVNVLLFIIKHIGKKQIRVFFDQWNSELMVNLFKKTKVDAKIYYLHYDNYHDFRERIYTGRIELLDYAPQTKEIKGLTLIKGVKVDRPEGGTKDICDTVAGAIYILTGKYDEKIKNKKKKGYLLREQGDGVFINGNLEDEDNPGMFIKHEEGEIIGDDVSVWDTLQ